MSKILKNECFINGVQYKCRICFDPGTTLYSLEDKCNNSKTWRDLLNEVAQMKTNENELLPRTVCCKCLDKLIRYYDFLIQIRNVNKKYLHLLTCSNHLSGDISTKCDSYSECLAEPTIALTSNHQYVSQIKFEDELVVPYDIVLNSSSKLLGDENDDAFDPFKETNSEDIKLPLNEMQDEQRSQNDELINKPLKCDYSNFGDEPSSTSSDESNCVSVKKRKKYKINFGNTSQQLDLEKNHGVEVGKSSNRFMCPVCKKTFSALRSCRRHMSTLHNRQTTFKNEIILNHRETTLKNESSSTSSTESDTELATSQSFREKNSQKCPNYIQTEKVNNGFACPICKKTFTLQRNCRRHITTIHCEKNRFWCGFCDQRYNCKEYLTVHLKRMHPGESFESNTKQIFLLFGDRLYSKPAPWRLLECKLCDLTFLTTKKLREHLLNHSDPNSLYNLQHNSNIVQFWFSNVSDLSLIKEMICKDIQDEQWFKYYTVLNEHSYEMSISDTDAEDLEKASKEPAVNKYHCELCAKDFSYKFQVFAHFKKDHIDEDIPLKCSRCKLEFISIKMYEQHRQTHCRNEHKTLICAHCPGKFVKHENMKNHNCITKITDTENQLKHNISEEETVGKNAKIIEHSEEKQDDGRIVTSLKNIIRCGLCDKYFEKLWDLRQHMPLHADGKSGIDFKGCIYVKQFITENSIDYLLLQEQIKNAFNKGQISHLYQALDKYGNEMDISDSDSCTEEADEKNSKKVYMCDLCKQMFKKRKLLLNHQNTRHNGAAMPFTCKDCKQQYVSIHLLQQHLKRECLNEHRRVASKCKDCNARFIWPENMLKHKKIQHQTNSAAVVSIESSNPGNEHPATTKLEDNTDEYQFHFCFVCPKKFLSIEDLNDHLSHHKLRTSDIKTIESIIYSTYRPNGKKVIKCETCGLLFKNMTALKKHFSVENPENLCANRNSPCSYSITNQNGFELHLDLDSETEFEHDSETKSNEETVQSFNHYKCCICNKISRRKYLMAQHQQSVHNYESMELKCERCIFRTVSQQVLEYHRLTQCFNVDKKYKCEECGFKFMWQENLENHISRFHTPKSISKAINFFHTAISQEVEHTSDNNNTSMICIETKELNSKDLLETSYKNDLNLNSCNQSTIKTKNKILCPICGASTSSSSNLAVHIMRHKGEKPYKCNICEMAFPRTADLQEHKSKHTDERPFKCKICEKSFKSQRTLRGHKRLHSDERPHQCTVCQKTFIRSDYLKLHMLGHSDERPFTCNICGKGYICASSLRKHCESKGHNELWSTPDKNSNSNGSQQTAPNATKNSLCPICGLCFSTNTFLTYHMRTHTGEKPYKCDLCDMTSARSYDLELHRRTHFADRPFKCKLCEKSFRDRYRLKVHLRTHTGERPYQCSICEKKFAKPSYLKLHLLNHTGEKPFRCEICDQAFICSAYLKKHRIKKGHHVENI